MTAIMIVALLARMQDASLNIAQRNNACYELRAAAAPEVVAAMRKALNDSDLRACAGLNLRAANAVPELENALADPDYEVRAIAARLLGTFQQPQLLPLLAKAARDPQLIVAANAIEGLSKYQDRQAVLPYLLDIAKDGGITGTAALNRALEFAAGQSVQADPRVLLVARALLGHSDVSDKLAAMRALAEIGDASDLPALREIIHNDSGNTAGQARGFGFMPAISLTRAAQTTIAAIETRLRRTAER